MMRQLAILAGVAACGSDPPVPDAMPDAAPRCDVNAPFGTPVPVGGLNTELLDGCARLSPDELVVVFCRLRSTGTFDLYTAQRASRELDFEPPELLATVNSVNSDLWPTMTSDGLLLLFESDRGTGISHIHVSRRASTAERFGTATAAPALMDAEIHPMLANNRALYFASAVRTGLGLHDIWRAEVDSTGATSAPVALVGGVNSAENELTPAVTEDELHIFFRRTVGTEHDIYMASRSTVQDGFGAAVPVLARPGVNEVPTWISADGCTLYLHSDAPGGLGSEDIYVARRGGV